ncbi:MAG: hypothetical protein MZV64_16605 [Ignavibacteriales bacterium]|nr:hypothetical protein [Ignavibacteriales bacterium]
MRTRGQARIFARTIGIDSARFLALTRTGSSSAHSGSRIRLWRGTCFPIPTASHGSRKGRSVISRLVGQFTKF